MRSDPFGTRRRASLAFGRGAKGPALGYHLSRSHELIDVEVCPVLSPRIVAALPKLRKALAPLVGETREAKVSVTETDNGLDIVVEAFRSVAAALAAFARQAPALGVARLTVGGESITTRAAPEVDLSDVKVKLPPGTFLQASREAETVMTGLVRD
jgi:23S rRNA (uracil1939-C5)-methyltransferase